MGLASVSSILERTPKSVFAYRENGDVCMCSSHVVETDKRW